MIGGQRIRFRYAFIQTCKPVLDDEPFRAFDTTADYRRWCEEMTPITTRIFHETFLSLFVDGPGSG